RRRHTRSKRDWSSDVCSSDLCSATLDTSSKSSVAVHTPKSSVSSQFFIKTPTTAYPCCGSSKAVTDESSPPLIPTTTREFSCMFFHSLSFNLLIVLRLVRQCSLSLRSFPSYSNSS